MNKLFFSKKFLFIIVIFSTFFNKVSWSQENSKTLDLSTDKSKLFKKDESYEFHLLKREKQKYISLIKDNIDKKSDYIYKDLIKPIITGEKIDILIGSPQRLKNFIKSDYCINRKSTRFFLNPCEEKFYGKGSKTSSIIVPIKLKISDDFWIFLNKKLKKFSKNSYYTAAPNPLKIEFKKVCHEIYGCEFNEEYIPVKLVQRLSDPFVMYYGGNYSWSKKYKTLDKFGKYSQGSDFSFSTIDHLTDEHKLFFFKDVRDSFKKKLKITQNNYCHPMLMRPFLGTSKCEIQLKNFFNPLQLTLLDKNRKILKSKKFEVWETQNFLRGFDNFCPRGGTSPNISKIIDYESGSGTEKLIFTYETKNEDSPQETDFKEVYSFVFNNGDIKDEKNNYPIHKNIANNIFGNYIEDYKKINTIIVNSPHITKINSIYPSESYSVNPGDTICISDKPCDPMPGDKVKIEITFSKKVFVTGKPQLKIKTNKKVGGSTVYCGTGNGDPYALINLKEGIIENEKNFILHLKYEDEIIENTKKIQLKFIKRNK